MRLKLWSSFTKLFLGTSKLLRGVRNRKIASLGEWTFVNKNIEKNRQFLNFAKSTLFWSLEVLKRIQTLKYRISISSKVAATLSKDNRIYWMSYIYVLLIMIKKNIAYSHRGLLAEKIFTLSGVLRLIIDWQQGKGKSSEMKIRQVQGALQQQKNEVTLFVRIISAFTGLTENFPMNISHAIF